MTVKDKTPKIIIVLPAYYAEKTLKLTINDIPKDFVSEIILVDDASKDKTVKLSHELGITTYLHPHNLGYGANQKTCYWEALKRKPSVIVMLHPDYQYDGKRIKELVLPILNGEYDLMIGSRIRTRQEALEGGMPLIKYLGNRILTTLDNSILGLNLSEHLSGFRAYSFKALTTIPFQRFSNDFVFDQQMIASAVSFNLKIGETPVPVRYFDKASSISGLTGLKYILESLICLFQYSLHHLGLVKSGLFR